MEKNNFGEFSAASSASLVHAALKESKFAR
jgi:hypothetical protein